MVPKDQEPASTAPGTDVEGLLAAMEAEKAAVLRDLRTRILGVLPPGYNEIVQGKFISYVVPLEKSGPTYNGQPMPIVSLAAQKNYFAIYLMCAYGNPARLRELTEGFRAEGKKLDMGKACIRFSSIDRLALDVILRIIADSPVDVYLDAVHRGLEAERAERAARLAAGPGRER